MLEADDLLSFQNEAKVRLSFGDQVVFKTHPYLEDKLWLPPRKTGNTPTEAVAAMGELFVT